MVSTKKDLSRQDRNVLAKPLSALAGNKQNFHKIFLPESACRVIPVNEPNHQPLPSGKAPKRVCPKELLEQVKAVRMGHWKDLNLPENKVQPIDSGRLNQDLTQVAKDQEKEPIWVPSYWRNDLKGLSSSFFLHAALLVFLVLWVKFPAGDGLLTIQGGASTVDLESPFDDPHKTESELLIPAENESPINSDDIDVESNIDADQTDVAEIDPSEFGTTALKGSTQAIAVRNPAGGGLGSRKDPKLRKTDKKFGPTKATEHAIDQGLAWLEVHQNDNDGSWSFIHPKGCTCDKTQAESHVKTAATGLALLAFLGRGYSHIGGDHPYRKNIADGLAFLVDQSNKNKGDLKGQFNYGMYGQGIGALALCEAYAMTKDQRLKDAAQKAVDFICLKSQGRDGGWRYHLGQPGDISVTAWQLMALKTAQLAGLEVPNKVLTRGYKFVETQSVSSSGGFTYPDNAKKKHLPGPTAMGVLLRMYNGWEREQDEIRRGVSLIFNHNFDPQDMYINYYATQVVFHFSDEELWGRWDKTMKSHLISTQQSVGHAKGSWNFPGCRHSIQGGRLYNTTLAIMMLEVYYRHLKLYDKEALIAEFPLDGPD